VLGSREGAIDKLYDGILKVVNDEDKARLVVRAGQSSAGYEISEYDMRLIQKYVDLDFIFLITFMLIFIYYVFILYSFIYLLIDILPSYCHLRISFVFCHSLV
jgi:hypothetical protein